MMQRSHGIGLTQVLIWFCGSSDTNRKHSCTGLTIKATVEIVTQHKVLSELDRYHQPTWWRTLRSRWSCEGQGSHLKNSPPNYIMYSSGSVSPTEQPSWVHRQGLLVMVSQALSRSIYGYGSVVVPSTGGAAGPCWSNHCFRRDNQC